MPTLVLRALVDEVTALKAGMLLVLAHLGFSSMIATASAVRLSVESQ
jgi:hypothetical protein